MINKFMLNHSYNKTISFHMPGHKGKEIYEQYGYKDFLKRIMDYDITEIPGADNLFQAEGIINATMDKYSYLYGVEKSYLLINGSSCGIMASIFATVQKGNSLLMARNCHKSVYNAIQLMDIKPIYVYPKITNGLPGVIDEKEIEELLILHDNIDAVILPSPNYWGICSDIKRILKICNKYNKVLIVDQAHGAHLKFFNCYAKKIKMPKAAEVLGADISVNSTHKTLASLTQSALINVNSKKVDLSRLEYWLQVLQSSSPSYILLNSLDINAELLLKHGKKLVCDWEDGLLWFYENAAKLTNINIMKAGTNFDGTKINIDVSRYGISVKNYRKYCKKTT